MQSYLHQKGRTKGYDTGEFEKANQHFVRWMNENPGQNPSVWREQNPELAGISRKTDMVPDAPFKKTWPELLMKRMIRYASENGYDGISWTPGEEQAARYDLSKQVDHVEYFPEKQILNAKKSGQHVLSEHVPPEKLPDTIGKEAARKLLESPLTKKNSETDYDPHHVLSGEDLKVGGEGMKGFYDKIVPEVANKLGKQFGAKVGETSISTEKPTRGENWEQVPMWETIADDGRRGKMDIYALFDSEGNWIGTTGDPSNAMPGETAVKVADKDGTLLKDAKIPAPEKGKKVSYFPITDSMRESVMKHGQPLFHRDASGVVTYFDQDNFSTRRTTGHNMLDPESIISGAELAAGFTYNNSHRVFRDQAQYDAVVSGQIPAYELPNVAPRRLNAKKSISEPEKNELFLLEGKKWRSALTPDEQQRYYNLSDRDLAGRYGVMLSAGAQKKIDDYRTTQEHIQALKAKAAEMNGQPVR